MGVVGEILVKYHPVGNNNLVNLLEEEGAEVILPDMMDFFLYCAYDYIFRFENLSGKKIDLYIGKYLINTLEKSRRLVKESLNHSNRFTSPAPIYEKADAASRIMSLDTIVEKAGS